MVFCAAVFFFCNDTATTEIYTYCHTLSLHDALPISSDQYDVMTRMAHDLGIVGCFPRDVPGPMGGQDRVEMEGLRGLDAGRSEEHTSELQSLMRISYAVFCLKKHKTRATAHQHTP